MLMKKLLLVLLLACSASCFAGNKIKYYFNQPVDTTVATAQKAVYLQNCIADTLAAYLGRAKYSLDICLYDFDKTLTFSSSVLDTVFAPAVAAAIDSAYHRGVKVRWIYEASNGNSGLDLIDTGIHKLGSPQGSNYTIMHNKFVVIDGNSSNPADAIVWTGCLNWYVQQFNWDYNNVVVVQDSALAHAYVAEFNMMWGDTGLVPNTTTSKFGQYKTDLGRHLFSIDGHTVELYFSPSDNTESHIQSTINTANTDLYFGMYTFTSTGDANAIVARKNAGVYVAGIDDSWSNSYSPRSIFNSNLGSNFKIYTETATSIYHNKFLIVDPSDTCSDPMVLTGSHNWSSSANTKNDENTLIIHDDTAANLFYQYFKASFNMLGGTLVSQHGCANVLVHDTQAEAGISVYPNPAAGAVTVACSMPAVEDVRVEICDALGRRVSAFSRSGEPAGQHSYPFTLPTQGIYFIAVQAGNTSHTFLVSNH
jgi:hypothetical protein